VIRRLASETTPRPPMKLHVTNQREAETGGAEPVGEKTEPNYLVAQRDQAREGIGEKYADHRHPFGAGIIAQFGGAREAIRRRTAPAEDHLAEGLNSANIAAGDFRKSTRTRIPPLLPSPAAPSGWADRRRRGTCRGIPSSARADPFPSSSTSPPNPRAACGSSACRACSSGTQDRTCRAPPAAGHLRDRQRRCRETSSPPGPRSSPACAARWRTKSVHRAARHS